MQTVAIAQAKNNFSAMLHFVEAGEDVVLTRHGKAIARIVPEPIKETSDVGSAAAVRKEAMSMLNSFRAHVVPGAHLDWKALRDAGKKY